MLATPRMMSGMVDRANETLDEVVAALLPGRSGAGEITVEELVAALIASGELRIVNSRRGGVIVEELRRRKISWPQMSRLSGYAQSTIRNWGKRPPGIPDAPPDATDAPPDATPR